MGSISRRWLTAIPILAGILFAAQVAISSSGSPPASKTGAPSENNCTQCHSGTANSGPGNISFNFDNNSTTYIGGQTYTIQLGVTDATKSEFGFQTVVLPQAGASSIGNFVVTNSTNTAVKNGNVTGNSRQYMGHRNSNSTKLWSFNWTAPSQGSGDVTFFVAGNAANGTGNTSGDNIYLSSFTINEFSLPITDFSANDSSVCQGDAVNFTDLSGGTPTSWSWTFQNGTPATSNLQNPTVVFNSVGNQTITLIATNANGSDTLTKTAYIEVNDLPAISLVGVTDVLCNGSSTGGIDVNVSGGDGNYTYTWSSGESTQDITGKTSGAYSLTVQDGNGCQDTMSFTISQPTAISINTSSTQANCATADGSVTAAAGGGTGNLSYLWSTGDTSQTVSSLPAGSYTVLVTDGNGCADSATVSVSNIGAPAITGTTTNPNCNGDGNGAIDVTISGGNGSLSYSWSNGDTTEDLSGISGGTYTLTVTDSLGCISIETFTINEPSPLTASSSATGEDQGQNNGTATITPSGGTPPYSVSWSIGQTGNTATNLVAGNYIVTVTDSNGCTLTDTVTVPLLISIDNSISEPELTLFPNPAANDVIVSLNTDRILPFNFMVYDMQGRYLLGSHKELSPQNDQFTLDISSLENGIYFITIAADNRKWTKKFMVKR